MKLNFYEAYTFFTYYKKGNEPFQAWAKRHYNEKYYMYDIPEAADNDGFKKWLLNKREADRKTMEYIRRMEK